MNLIRIGLVTGLAALLAACTVGPDYKTPDVPQATLKNADPVAVAAGAEPEAAWWHLFEDPELDRLVERGEAGNLDLGAAIARVRQARALFDDAQRDRYPRVTSQVGYDRSDEQIPGFGTKRTGIESVALGFDASWELDLFGHTERGIEAAEAEAGAADADVRDARVTVAAEIARNYFELRGAQARRQVAERNAETQRQTLKLTQTRMEIGRGDPSDVENSKARLAAIEATIPSFVTTEKQASHRLAVLIAAEPGSLDDELAPLAVPAKPLVKPLPIGDAGSFLRRRPDIQAAERRLAAQTAQVGVATADLFPRVNITGFIGLLSGDVSHLFVHNAAAWSVAPTVSWPAFDLGGAEARLHAQEARNDETLANYHQTVLRALEDLQTALVAYRQQQMQIGSLAEQVEASRRAADLIRLRYQEGTVDFLALLDAERTQLAAEDALSVAETGADTGVVAIYKALGGNWS